VAEAAEPKLQTAVLAGGCFWGMQEVLRKLPGVVRSRVGYAGGNTSNPTYEDVSSGTTGYAESIEIQFDPSKLSYEQLLLTYFRMHDPTSLNRQGNDVGTQYRSEIFYENDDQKKIALAVKDRVQKSGKWKKDIVTKIEPFKNFVPAEAYHQDYLVKNPGGYNDHYLRDFKFE
jgi:methionine-S-sulfoxide reductase